jgi:hypothetical protein
MEEINEDWIEMTTTNKNERKEVNSKEKLLRA